MTPTVRPSRSRGRLTALGSPAITDASGRWTIGITPTRSKPRSRAIARSWMSRIANWALPASSSFGASVDADGCWTLRSMPARSVEALLQGGVDARVDGVGLEVEDEGRSLRSARFSTAAARHQRGDHEGGRQQRSDPLHRPAEDSLAYARLPAVATGDDHLLAYVEIPKGSRNKYEYDEGLGELVLDRFLSSSTVYPTDYGYLIGHRGRDGDPLDAMVCVSEPTFPGCVIPVKPIALFKMWDEKGEDDKVVCVPLNDPGWNHAETLDDIPQPLQREITHFFSDLQGARGQEGGRGGVALTRGGARRDRGRKAPTGARRPRS